MKREPGRRRSEAARERGARQTALAASEEGAAEPTRRAPPVDTLLPGPHFAWVVLACTAAIAIAYANVLEGQLVWDDVPLIQQDDRLRSLEHLGEIFSSDFFERSDDSVKYGYYRPLVTASYALDRALHGLSPRGFHLTNVLLHLGCTLLVYALGARVLSLSFVASLAAAVVFALHPVHTESVSWISGRTDVLATLLLLTALYFHEASLRPSAPKHAYRGMALFSFALALLAKELALALPLVIAALALGRRSLRQLGRELWPYAGLIGLYFVVRLFVLGVATNRPRAAPLSSWLGTLPVALLRYLGELIWPLPLSAYLQQPWVSLGEPRAWLALLGCGVLGVLVYQAWRTRELRLVALWLALLASLLPMSNLVPISGPKDMGFVMAERFLYWPSVFFCIALGLAFDKLLASPAPAKRFAAAAIALGLAALSASAVIARNRDYRDDGQFMRATIAQAPDAYLLHGRLGAFYSLKGAHPEALASLEQARALFRKTHGHEDPALASDLATALRRAGRLEEALGMLEPLARTGTRTAVVHASLGETLRLLGRLEESKHHLERALELDPRSIEARLSLARLEAERGELDAALAHQEAAVAAEPNDGGLLLVRGDLERRRGNLAAAEQHYQRALALEPKLAHAHAALGALLAERGETARAVQKLQQALALDETLTDAELALCVIDARAGKLQDAKRRLERILTREPSHFDAQATLISVLLGLGQVEAAEARLATLRRARPTDARVSALATQVSRTLEARGYSR